MKLTRREMIVMTGTAGAAFMLTGCPPFGTIWSEIETYVPIGVDAADAVLSLVAPQFAPLANIAAGLVKAGVADLDAFVNDLRKPGADTTTLAGKVKTTITGISNDFQSLLASLESAGDPDVSKITGLVSVILDTLAGFAEQIPSAPVAVATQHAKAGRVVVIVHPTRRNEKTFVAAFNAAADQIGRADLHIPRRK